jgi:ABC-type nitrate/sulfonate/bicarbonate transport system permease component
VGWTFDLGRFIERAVGDLGLVLLDHIAVSVVGVAIGSCCGDLVGIVVGVVDRIGSALALDGGAVDTVEAIVGVACGDVLFIMGVRG